MSPRTNRIPWSLCGWPASGLAIAVVVAASMSRAAPPRAGARDSIHALAAAGDVPGIERWLRSDPAVANARDKSGYTPLHVAAKNLRVEAVDRLLAAGADVTAKDRTGFAALHLALFHGGSDKDAVDARVALVDLLLTRGAEIRAADEFGKTPVHIAAMKGRVEVLDRLLDAGADTAARDRLRRTPLHEAALYGQAKAIEWLVEHDADIEAKDKHDNTPLHCAALRFRRAAAEKLLALGATVDARNDEGATPLHVGAAAGPEEPEVERLLIELADVLLDNGADAAAKDKSGRTPADLAREKNRRELAAVLGRGDRDRR